MKLESFLLLCLLLLIPLALPSSVAAQAEDINLTIARPSEGETFYYGPSTLLYNIWVTGTVAVSEGKLEDVRLSLEILHEGTSLGSQQIRANALGTYIFFATVNPASATGQHSDSRRYMGLTDTCGGSCHDTKVAQLDLVPGQLLVRVTAEDGQGRTSSAERNIFVDSSVRATIPVRVVHKDNPDQALGGIPVRASTWIYMWRARHYSAASDADGYSPLTAEALALAPTHYVLRVDPVVVDGVYYEGVAPVSVTLPPGARIADVVTLEVTSASGTIQGDLAGAGNLGLDGDVLTVWAVAPERGYCAEARADKAGHFDFQDLPVANYLVMLDPFDLAQRNRASEAVPVDLFQTTSAEIELPVSSVAGNSVRISVVGEAGPLPFAWITLPEAGKAYQVYPGSGEGYLTGLSTGKQPVVVTAPGYYSSAEVSPAVADELSAMTVSLVPRPDARLITWGDGTLFLPNESQADVTERTVRLVRGWLWGTGGGPHAASLLVDDVEIRIDSGSFALEALPERAPLLYLMEGSAELSDPSRLEVVSLKGGQMVSLQNLQPMPLSPVTVTAVQGNAGEPIEPTWQPGFASRLHNQLILLGVGSAQFITYVTYILGALSIVVAPLVLVFLLIRNRAKG